MYRNLVIRELLHKVSQLHYKPTSGNYNTVIETLKDRFEDEHRVQEVLYRKQLALQPKTGSCQDMKEHFDNFE